MMELYVWACTNYKNKIWFSDYFTGGLYTYDTVADSVCCEVKPDILFSYNVFKIETIACWRQYVFVFSKEWCDSHIIYDCITKKIIQISGLRVGGFSSLHKAVVLGDILYLIPWKIDKYIITIDLANFAKGENIERLFEKRTIFGSESSTLISVWLPRLYKNSIYVSDTGGQQILQITNKSIRTIKTDMSIPIGAISIYNDKFWILPLHGNNIFCFSLSGDFLEKRSLDFECKENERNGFCNIIATDFFVLLIHGSRQDIFAINKKNGRTMRVDCSTYGLKEMPDEYDFPYHIEKDIIKFLPLKRKYFEINLSTFECVQRDTLFCADVSKTEWDCWSRMVFLHTQSDGILKENNNLKEFIRYI